MWVSRAVHPAFGFMSNLSFNFWMIYFFGVYATLLGSWGTSALFRVLAAYTGQSQFLAAADFFVTEWGVFLLGCAVVLIMGGLFILNRGLETFFRAQKWGFLLWLVGTILLATLAVLLAGPTGFVERFNTYVTALGGQADAHAAILQAGAAPSVPATFAGSLLLVTIPYYTMGFIFQSAYFGGEIKRGRKTHLTSMAGSLVLAAAIMLVVTWVFLAIIGRPFLAALGLVPDPERLRPRASSRSFRNWALSPRAICSSGSSSCSDSWSASFSGSHRRPSSSAVGCSPGRSTGSSPSGSPKSIRAPTPRSSPR